MCSALLFAQAVGMSAEDIVRLEYVLYGGLFLVVLFLLGCVLPVVLWRRRLQRRGYPGVRAYFLELPRTDAEKMDAVELTLKGVVLCCLSLLFPPLIILGLFPLYFGIRKLASSQLGIKSLEANEPK